MTTTIYGASDDLIEVEGACSEEFSVYNKCENETPAAYLACSDGTLLKVKYDGQWRFHLMKQGSAAYSKEEATDEAGSRPDGKPAYSDVVTLDGDVRWVVFTTQAAIEPVGRAFSRNMAAGSEAPHGRE